MTFEGLVCFTAMVNITLSILMLFLGAMSQTSSLCYIFAASCHKENLLSFSFLSSKVLYNARLNDWNSCKAFTMTMGQFVQTIRLRLDLSKHLSPH